MKKPTQLQKKGKIILACITALVCYFPIQAQVPVPSGLEESMRVSLFHLAPDNSTALADGNLTNYDDIFMDEIGDDAYKLSNFGENFGILRSGTVLVIEQRKKIVAKDTTYFHMWNMEQRNYRLTILAKNLNHPGLLGYFEDAYLNTSTALNLNAANNFDFAVTAVAGSYATNRFRIVFKNPSLSPLSTVFTGFSATLNGSNVHLQWTIENEISMKEYIIEHSADLINFKPFESTMPLNSVSSKTYEVRNALAMKGENYYRIKAVSMNGEVQFSNILNVKIQFANNEFDIYPNPVVDKKIYIKCLVNESGKYNVILFSSNGLSQQLSPIQVSQGRSIRTIVLPHHILPGIYRLKLIGPDNQIVIKTIKVL